MTEPETQRLSRSIPQVIKALGLSRATVYRMIARGEIETFEMLPGKQFVPEDSLQAFLAARRAKSRARGSLTTEPR